MEESNPLIIAIDGPAASGKSTVARGVAQRLGLVFVSSGAMYRAFTWWVLENRVDPSDRSAVLDLLNRTEFVCGKDGREGTIDIGGKRMTDAELSATAVNGGVSRIASIPEVRERLVAEQRRYGADSGVVMEGRDIGSVVFPDTPNKFYIDAAPEVRAARRRAQGIIDSVSERDRMDSSRSTSPLLIPEGAVVVDSSHLTAEEVVSRVIDMIVRRESSELQP